MRIWFRVSFVMCIICLHVSCTGLDKLGHTLNERQVTSCVYTQGGYGIFMQVRTVSATGGADLETCIRTK